MITILKQILFRRNCEDSEKMTLNLIMIQKRFWKDDIEKVKINIMEDSLNTNNVQKKLRKFFKDDTEFWKDNIENVKNNNMTNFSTTNLFVSQLSSVSFLKYFQISVSSLKNLYIFFWTKLVFKEFSIMLIFTFSMSSFQNRFCITIKFSIIFEESSVSSE